MKSAGAALTSSQRRFSAGRMKTSQKRSIASLGLAEPAEKDGERLVVVPRRIEPAEAAAHARDRKPVAEGNVPVAEKPERSRRDEGDAAVLGDDRQRERLATHRPPDRSGRGSSGTRCSSRGRCAGRCPAGAPGRPPRGQRLHGAAERGTGLQNGHVVPRIGQLERGGEPGEAPADHRRLHSAATARSLPTAESCGRCEKTS